MHVQTRIRRDAKGESVHINIPIGASAWDAVTLHATDMPIFGQVEFDGECVCTEGGFSPSARGIKFHFRNCARDITEKDGCNSSVLYKEL